MKILKTFVILIVILVAGLVLGKNIIAKVAIEKGVEAVTGLPLTLQSLDVNLTGTFVDVDGLKLQNPKEFQDRIMLQMSEIFIDYNLPAILKGHIHLPEVRIHLEEFAVVKNAKGELNLDTLKALQPEEKADTKKEKPAEKGKAPSIQLDLLTLKIGKVVYKDYSKGGEPVIKEFKLGVDEKFENITDPNVIVRLLVLKVMIGTPLAALTNFDVAFLKEGVGSVLSGSTEALSKAAEQASTEASKMAKKGLERVENITAGLENVAVADKTKAITKGATESLTGAAEDLKGGLKDAAGTLTESLGKLPFGKSTAE